MAIKKGAEMASIRDRGEMCSLFHEKINIPLPLKYKKAAK